MNNMPFLVGGRRASHTQFYPGVNIQRGPKFSGGGETTINFNYNNNGFAKAAKYNFFTNAFLGTLDFFAGLMPWNKGKVSSFQSFSSFGTMSPFGMTPYQQFNSFSTGINPTGFGQAQGAADPNLAKLQTVYSQYKVMPDSGGKYILTKGDGTAITGTFDELMAKATGGAQGTSTPANSTPANSTPATSTPTNSTPASNVPQGAKWSNVVPDDFKDFKGNIIVHDDGLGDRGNISGETKILSSIATGENKGLPQKLSVDGHEYTFEKSENGVMWYKSGSSKGQLYRLEKNASGEFQLNQHANDAGYNEADITRSSGQRNGGAGGVNRAPKNNPSQPAAAPKKPSYAEVKANLTISGRPSSSYNMDIGGEHTTIKNPDGITSTTYYPQTVSTKVPLNPVSYTVPAAKVAELGGNAEKIKEYAYSQMDLK